MTKEFCLNFLKHYWLVLATVGLIIFTFTLSLNQLFFFQFVDEEDNFILGHFLLSGQKLYSQLFSHHQPFAYLISAFVQWIFQPDGILELVRIHRYFMVGWSIFWIIILVWRFREKIYFALVIFEILKLYVLGNLFLSESLAVYPVFYLLMTLFVKIRLSREYIWIGFLVSFLMLLLSPLWPLLIMYLFSLFWRIREKNIRRWFFAGFIIPILIVLPFTDLYYYFHNVFFINFKYYIPQSAEEKMPLAIIKAFFSPLILLSGPNTVNTLSLNLKVILAIFMIGIFGLVRQKKYSLIVIILGFLTLTNVRYYAPYLEYKAGFHNLIWIGIFLVFTFYSYLIYLYSVRNIVLRHVLWFFLLILIVGMYFLSPVMFYKQDNNENFKVNYREKIVFGESIKAMRLSGDSLFVIPDEWLLYFQGDVQNYSRMVNYYGWMSLVWELNDPVKEKFVQDPPAFFYCDCPEETVLSYSDKFQQLSRNGAKTPLWILKSKFALLNDIQKQKLRDLSFQLE